MEYKELNTIFKFTKKNSDSIFEGVEIKCVFLFFFKIGLEFNPYYEYSNNSVSLCNAPAMVFKVMVLFVLKYGRVFLLYFTSMEE